MTTDLLAEIGGIAGIAGIAEIGGIAGIAGMAGIAGDCLESQKTGEKPIQRGREYGP